MRKLLLALGVSLVVLPSFAAAPPLPRDVVKTYLDLDANGVRLSSDTWNKVAPLITWKDEPGWDDVAIIGGYDLGEVKNYGKRVAVTVTYHTVAISSGESFEMTPANEVIVFELVKKGGAWKIEEPQIRPHVSTATYFAQLREIERAEPSRKRELEKRMKDIEAAAASLPQTLTCKVEQRFKGGGSKEQELSLVVEGGRVTHLSYSNVTSNGREGGAYRCELELSDPAAKAGKRTRLVDKEAETESYAEVETLADGYRVIFDKLSTLAHCGAGSELPHVLVINRANPTCGTQ